MKDYDYILQVLDDTQFELKYGEIYVSNISEQYKPEDDIWESMAALTECEWIEHIMLIKH